MASEKYDEDDAEELKILGKRVYDDALYQIEASLDANEHEVVMRYDDPVKRLKELLVFRGLKSRAILSACSAAEKGARMKKGILGKENMMQTDEEDRDAMMEKLLDKVMAKKGEK